jgi:hypothetical protein
MSHASDRGKQQALAQLPIEILAAIPSELVETLPQKVLAFFCSQIRGLVLLTYQRPHQELVQCTADFIACGLQAALKWAESFDCEVTEQQLLKRAMVVTLRRIADEAVRVENWEDLHRVRTEGEQ